MFSVPHSGQDGISCIGFVCIWILSPMFFFKQVARVKPYHNPNDRINVFR